MWSPAAAAVFAFLLAAVDAADKETEAIKYLSQYGYIETGKGSFVDVDILNDAVKNFQDFAGLEKTGFIDQETQKLMQTPRCGVEDKIANFVVQGSKWPKKDLTYRISKYSNAQGLSRKDVEKTTRQAFSMWEEASDLRFTETRSGTVDIDIKFEQYSHGDGSPFDGPGGVLAHAYFPQFGGRAHFDDSEKWSVTPYKGNQLLNTLTHEFGHSLGLRHSSDKGSIMAPFYKGWDPNLQLGEDDKRGIKSLYGKTGRPRTNPTAKPITTARPTQPTRPIRPTRPTRPTRTSRPTIPTLPTGPTNNADLCSSKINTIVQTSDGNSYVFKGDNYWKLTSDRVAPGYPRKISQDWPGLPGNIDSALTWKKNGVTFFFKGDQYWMFKGQSPVRGYPKDISNWGELPSNLDAAFEWGRNGNLYFFKGSQYWKFDTNSQTMAEGYPRDISAWKNVPGNVDAAFQWRNGKTYFFKSGNYWRFNDETVSVDRSNPTFPRDAGQWWYGCPKKRQNNPFVDATDPGFVEKVDIEH